MALCIFHPMLLKLHGYPVCSLSVSVTFLTDPCQTTTNCLVEMMRQLQSCIIPLSNLMLWAPQDLGWNTGPITVNGSTPRSQPRHVSWV